MVLFTLCLTRFLSSKKLMAFVVLFSPTANCLLAKPSIARVSQKSKVTFFPLNLWSENSTLTLQCNYAITLGVFLLVEFVSEGDFRFWLTYCYCVSPFKKYFIFYLFFHCSNLAIIIFIWTVSVVLLQLD